MTTQVPALSDYDLTCRRLMPALVGPVYCELRHSLMFLRQIQTLLFELFWEEEPAALLHHTSPFFSYAINQCLLREILLNAARLTDPAASGGGRDKANLSFAKLLSEIEASANPTLAAKISSAVAAISFAAEDIHKLRSKVLAHADFSTATAASPPPLPEVSREQFEVLTNQMVSVLQDIEQHYCGSSTNYDGEAAKRASIELLGALRRARL